MRHIARRLQLALAATAVLVLGAGAAALAKPVTPEAGTVYETLYKGLELVAEGKFDAFIKDFCSKEKLCSTDQAISSLKKYNLPAAQRQAPKCLHDGKLEVTRVQGEIDSDDEVKIFIQCDKRGMPRPYTMVKESGKWFFKNIY